MRTPTSANPATTPATIPRVSLPDTPVTATPATMPTIINHYKLPQDDARYAPPPAPFTAVCLPYIPAGWPREGALH